MESEYKEYKRYTEEFIDEYLNEEFFSKDETLAFLIDNSLDTDEVRTCSRFIPFGYLAITMRRISKGLKNEIKSKLMNIDMEVVKQNVSDEDYEEISKSINEILIKIDNIEISTFNGCVCWEYEEINEEVEKYLNTLNLDKNTIEETIRLTLKRFERACYYTRSEEVCVYVTLAEKLLGYVDNEEFEEYNKLIDFIKAFELKSIENEQFTESEKEDLVGRIDKILYETRELRE